MRLLAEQCLSISALLPEKNQIHVGFFDEFYGGHVEQLTDIYKQLRPGRRGMACVRAVEQCSALTLICGFHSTPINIFHFCGFSLEFLLP